jgi:hypothetical protein
MTRHFMTIFFKVYKCSIFFAIKHLIIALTRRIAVRHYVHSMGVLEDGEGSPEKIVCIINCR